MFVLRDFNDQGNNYENIMNQIKTDIDNIWAKIFKPDEYKDKKASDFFDFDFTMLPHKVFQEEQFNLKVDALKVRFDRTTENNIYPKGDNKNLPIDGFQVFIDKTWDVIRHQKELNLPDQRQMVANFRCAEIKEEAVKLV